MTLTIKRTLQIGLLSFACVFTSGLMADTFSFTNMFSHLFASSSASVPSDLDTQAKLLSSKAQNLDPEAIKLGLEAYNKARLQGLDTQQVLTVVDFSKPSVDPRFVVFDLKTDSVLYQELVAHGQNSGGNMADSFSNDPSSHKSSLGLYLTQQTYSGHHGYSLKLDGLEKGVNDTAAAREIVVHSAAYVSDSTAQMLGRLGRSWGCFALNPSVAPAVISTIKNGTLLFAYYPDRHWISDYQSWISQASSLI